MLFGPFLISQFAKIGANYTTLNSGYLLICIFALLFFQLRIGFGFILAAMIIFLGLVFVIFLDASSAISFLMPFKFFLIACLSPIYFRRFNHDMLFFIKFVSIASLVTYVLVLFSSDAFNFFLPFTADGSSYRVATSYETWDYSAWFLFNNQVSLGLFCVGGLFFLLLNDISRKHKILCILLVVNIVLSKSLLCYLAVFLLYGHLFKNTYSIVGLYIICLSSFFLLFDFLIGDISYSLYLDLVRLTRGGILIDLLPHFFNADPFQILFGLDSEKIVSFISTSPNVPITLEYAFDTAPLEDVYYVYYLYQFGLVMFVIFLFTLLGSLSNLPKTVRLPMSVFIIFGLFVNQLMSFTIFNFFFFYCLYYASVEKKYTTRSA